MDPIEILGIIASISSAILHIPQVYHMIKTKGTKDVSYNFLGLTLFSCLLWLIYGLLIINIPLIISDSILSITTLIMIGSKIYFENYSSTTVTL